MNEKNLIPFSERTESEQRKIRQAGGIASGQARSFRAATKRRLRENPEMIESILDKLIAMFNDDGDLQALSLLLELAGESPRQMEIAIKKQELKLKKEIAENGNW